MPLIELRGACKILWQLTECQNGLVRTAKLCQRGWWDFSCVKVVTRLSFVRQ